VNFLLVLTPIITETEFMYVMMESNLWFKGQACCPESGVGEDANYNVRVSFLSNTTMITTM